MENNDIVHVYANIIEGKDYSLEDYTSETPSYYLELDINNIYYLDEYARNIIDRSIDKLYEKGKIPINKHCVLNINNDEAIIDIQGNMATITYNSNY